MAALGSLLNSARSRSYTGGYGPLEPGSIGPGLSGFPRISALGNPVNRVRKQQLVIRHVTASMTTWPTRNSQLAYIRTTRLLSYLWCYSRHGAGGT